jgi:hypothetical protein
MTGEALLELDGMLVAGAALRRLVALAQVVAIF